MNFKEFYIKEVLVPMGVSWSKWQSTSGGGMTAKEFLKVNPGTRFRIVDKDTGKDIKGSEDKEYKDALKMLRAIKVNQK